MATLAMTSNALETTKLDIASLYKSAALAGPIAPRIGKQEGICSMIVHTVKPNLDVPKLPTVSYDKKRSLPSALRRRLARRYEERGEPVPDYLLDEED